METHCQNEALRCYRNGTNSKHGGKISPLNISKLAVPLGQPSPDTLAKVALFVKLKSLMCDKSY